jgi:hypothetical protein
VAGVPVTVLIVVTADPDSLATARWWTAGLDVTPAQREERGKSEHVWQNGRDFSRFVGHSNDLSNPDAKARTERC